MSELADGSNRKELLYSPLKRFQKQHCQQCGDTCSPGEQRMLLCILAALQDTIQRVNTLIQQRGAHF